MRLAQVCGEPSENIAPVIRTAYIGGVKVSEIAIILSLSEQEVKELVATGAGPGGRERRHLAEDGMILDKHYPPKGERIA